MRSSLEHIDACLPVTTLQAFVFGGTKFLLLGQGPYARLIKEDCGNVAAYLRIFKRNNVHGLTVIRRNESEAETASFQLLAWGAQSLRLIELHYVSDTACDKPAISLVVSSAEYLAPDWILAGCTPSTSHENNAAYLVTAHNAVLGLTVVKESSSKYPSAIHLRQLVVGVKSILYSADIIPISPTRLLVAAGTVFGEIIVWSCFPPSEEGPAAKAASSIHHFFTGHEGSIFGVEISPEIANLHGALPGRLLTSCSDDRTIRVWDISDCEHVSPHDPSAYSTDGFELRCTGFGSVKQDDEFSSESCVASAFGHGARIWGVHFIRTQCGGQSKVNLVSRGEDAHCLVWDLTWKPSAQKSEFKLSNVCSLHLHDGKHIWSLEMRNTDAETIIYTGGADGAVKTFELEIRKNGEVTCRNRNDPITAAAGPGSGKGAKVAMKAFDFVSPDCFLASTTLGEVQVGWVESPSSSDRRIIRETLSVEEDLRQYSIISGLSYRGVALVGNEHGHIRLYDHDAKSLSKIADVGQRPVGLYALSYHPKTSDTPAKVSFLVVYSSLDSADVFNVYLSQDTEPRVERIPLQVYEGFHISCASLVKNDQYLALGSRYGSLAIYRIEKVDILPPLLKEPRIHSKEGVNRIIPFSSLSSTAGSESEYFLTCGRDWCYRVFALESLEGSASSATLRTIHSPTNLGHDVEGAYIDSSSQDLMLYGFRGMDFILWNESKQSEIARITCGGARRHWAFQPSSQSPGDALLIWAQSGFHAFPINTRTTRTIRAGGHGREIKTLGGLQPMDVDKRPLFVTGSEDTTLRIFTPTLSHAESPFGALKCIRVLTAHDTGSQHVGWSRDGKFMFTSSAAEDFLVWRVRSIPVFGFAAALVGSCPKSHPKSELRVTSFDVLEVEDREAEASFLLCLTYSNSTITVFHFSARNHHGHFTLLASGTYTSNCLTQARFLRNQSSVCLITTSTDGHFTLWNLSSILEPFYTLTPTLGLKQSLGSITVTPGNIACENRYQIHGNSIKALDLVHLSEASTLVIAGGDDNALTLSLLDTEFEAGDMDGRTATVTIPDAHTASINAVKAIEQSVTRRDGTTHLSFVSSGNDHRVKIWRVDIDMRCRPNLDGIRVQNELDEYSPVADISSLDVVEDEGTIKLLVCGVGMEMFKINIR